MREYLMRQYTYILTFGAVLAAVYFVGGGGFIVWRIIRGVRANVRAEDLEDGRPQGYQGRRRRGSFVRLALHWLGMAR